MRIRNEFILIALVGLLLLALIVWSPGLPTPLLLLRLVLGLTFTLLIPGYLLQAAIFPRAGELDGANRLALSIGLSLAVLPLMALLLDQMPGGIQLWPIVALEGAFDFVCALVAWLRRRRLPQSERFLLIVGTGARRGGAARDRAVPYLYGVLVVAFLLALGAAVAIAVLPGSGEHYTEFYLLGSEELAEGYPWQALAGQAVDVTVGIANREGLSAEYRIEIVSGGRLVGQAGPLILADGETDERPVSFTPVEVGDNEITFILYRDGIAVPYRTLRLWLHVAESLEGGSRK